MRSRTAAWLAWSLFGLYVLTVLATWGLILSGSGTADEAFVILALGFATVGALVASREPANAVGWLLLGTAVVFGLGTLGQAYIWKAGRPGEGVMGWFAYLSQYVWLWVPVLFLPLLFPNGRLLSPTWRVAVWMGSAALGLIIAGTGFVAGSLDTPSAEQISNPFGVGGPLAVAMPAAVVVGNGLAAAVLVLGAVSLVLRMRRSRGRERQQLKLFAYVGTLALAGFVLGMPDVLAGESSPMWAQVAGSVGYLTALPLIFIGLPVAIGVAILRHRLYDIDVVINRTLVYGVLTGTLAVCYLGLVLLFGLVLGPVSSDSDLAVAGSTLAVAALFRPARRRVQTVVDRRFYRARYDASRTLEGFAGRLRDELDLDTLAAGLRQVAQDTLQPTHVSLWLRETDR
jgi:hypothetical protein